MPILPDDHPETSTFLLLITGPSGVGKSSLLEWLLAKDPRLDFSVSCTTRPPRADEEDGVDYHFIGSREFERLRDEGAFVEWAEVHGHLYGTRFSEIDRALQAGDVPVLDVDVQGGLNILRAYGEQAVSVFVLPPSWQDLERRLRGRGTDDTDVIDRRLRNARGEIAAARHYSYWLVNDDLDDARERLWSIVRAEAIRRERFEGPSVA